MAVAELVTSKSRDILRITARHGADNVRVFGSAARGECRPDSDIDVLIDLAPDRSLLDIVAIKQDLEDLLGLEVHVVTMESVSPYIRDQVIKEAVGL